MNETNKHNKRFVVDFSWYLLGSIFPMLIGFIKIPIFTRHFSENDYGYYGLVVTTFVYFSMFLFSWLASCVWRFYNQYINEGRLKAFYSNIAFLYFISITVLSLIFLVWYSLAENLLIQRLILFSYLQLIFNQFILLYMIVVRIKGKAYYYNIFHSVRVLISFGLLLLLAFKFNFDISALIISLACIDFLLVIFLLVRNPIKLKVSKSEITQLDLKKILNYGAVGLLANAGLLVILSSDRYIIAIFEEIRYVGIYDQVYKIAQISTVAVATVFMNTINPNYVQVLENNFEKSATLLSKYVSAFLIIGLPIIVYASLFSKQIAFVMLGPNFREGYFLLPYIFLGTYLFFVAQFWESRLKFSNKLKSLSIAVILAAVLNVGLNFIMIPWLGYHWASITTLIAYAFLLLLFYSQDNSAYFSQMKNLKMLSLVLLVLILQVIAHQFLIHNFKINLTFSVVEAIVLMLMYFLIFRKKIMGLEIPIN